MSSSGVYDRLERLRASVEEKYRMIDTLAAKSAELELTLERLASTKTKDSFVAKLDMKLATVKYQLGKCRDLETLRSRVFCQH